VDKIATEHDSKNHETLMNRAHSSTALVIIMSVVLSQTLK